MIAICSDTSVYVGVTIFALVRSCRRVDRLETTRFLSATGVGFLIAVASATFVCAHKGLAGFVLESKMTAYCSNTTAYVGVTIFALCWSALSLPGSCQPLESEFLIAVASGTCERLLVHIKESGAYGWRISYNFAAHNQDTCCETVIVTFGLSRALCIRTLKG